MTEQALSRRSTTELAKKAVPVRQQFLAFLLKGELLALDILQVREIIEFGAITEVPLMPAAIRGVINLRGAVVPVVDLSVRLGKGDTVTHKRSCVIIVEVPHDDRAIVLGILVDGVSAVLDIDNHDIEPPPAFGAPIRTDFIAGIAKVAERFILVLNVGKVFSVRELAVLDGEARADATELVE